MPHGPAAGAVAQEQRQGALLDLGRALEAHGVHAAQQLLGPETIEAGGAAKPRSSQVPIEIRSRACVAPPHAQVELLKGLRRVERRVGVGLLLRQVDFDLVQRLEQARHALLDLHRCRRCPI